MAKGKGCQIKVYSSKGHTSSFPLNAPGWNKAYSRAREVAASDERAQVEIDCNAGNVSLYECYNDRMGKGCTVTTAGGGDPEKFPSIAGARVRRRRRRR